jgi:hypothetical protein
MVGERGIGILLDRGAQTRDRFVIALVGAQLFALLKKGIELGVAILGTA